MSLEKFDEAMVNKLMKVFPNVQNAQEDRLTSDATDEKAKLRLPLVTVWRVGNPLAFGQMSNDSMVRRGYRYQESNNEGLRVKALPVRIQYQIDILSDRRVEVDGIFRELAMYLYESAILPVEFSMGENEPPLVREFTINLLDNNPGTDFGSFSDRGKLYKETLNVEIPNAQLLFTESTKLVLDIPIRLYTLSKDGGNYYEVKGD